MTPTQRAVLASGLTLMLLRTFIVPIRRGGELTSAFFFEMTWHQSLSVAWDVLFVYTLMIASATAIFYVLTAPRSKV